MTQIVNNKRKKDLSHINNIDDLKTEILATKIRIRQAEVDFEDRWKRLPQESIKATLGSVIPLFLNNKIAGGTWSVLSTILKMFLGKTGKDGNDTLVGSLLKGSGKVGIFAALKTAYSIFRKKKKEA